MTDNKPHIQEVESTPKKINTKIYPPKHIFKQQKTKLKEKIMEVRGKNTLPIENKDK